MFNKSGRFRKFATVLALALVVIVVCVVLVSPTVSANTAGNEGSFVMSANGAVSSISVTDVIAPFGGSLTVYLKDSGGSTLATGGSSGSWGSETVTISFDEAMVYSGQTYSIEVYLSGDGSSHSGAYLTYTPYYLITVTSVGNYGSPAASMYVRSGASYATNVTSPATIYTGARAVCIS